MHKNSNSPDMGRPGLVSPLLFIGSHTDMNLSIWESVGVALLRVRVRF